MDRNDHIILRYLIGTVVEIVVLVALAIAAIIGVLEAIGWFIEWAARNMPDWMIIPEFMMIFVLAFIAMFPEICATGRSGTGLLPMNQKTLRNDVKL